MGGSSHATFAVGAIVMAGGIFAYASKGSVASLVGSSFICIGLVSGGLLIQNSYDFQGHCLAGASSLLLSGIAVKRLMATGKMMPAVPLLLLGSISSAYQLKKALEWSK